MLEKDLQGTLQKIADIGYKNMESAAGSKGHYYGLKPKEFASMLDGMGIHSGVDTGRLLAAGRIVSQALDQPPRSRLAVAHGEAR